MCLSTVYKTSQKPENIVLTNVQRIEDKGGTIVLTNRMMQALSTSLCRAPLENAADFWEALDGVAYEPIALLGTQVVAGMNYCILCRAWPATPDAQVGFVLAYVYADLEGNATFTHFAQIDIAALAQGE